MTSTNWLDKAIAWVSPDLALKRERARLRLEMVRGYDGAKSGRRTDGWAAPTSSATAEIVRAGPRLRDRSRDLARNNAWARKAAMVIAANVVGAGIVAQPKARRSRRRAEAATELWQAWAETTQCDADGRHNIYGLQLLAMQAIVESGEVLIRRRRRRDTDGLPVPLQIQILEPDYLDISHDGVSNGNIVRGGIEFDSLGRRVAYWLYPQHPGEATNTTLTSARVPASDVAHVYRCDRPGQVRGAPWSAPVIVDLKDLADYESAQLLKQKIAACYAAFVVETEAPELAQGQSELAETIEPGAVEVLPPGRDIRFASPPSNDGYEPYVRQLLLKIAAGYGITYEALTSDLSEVNFSSGRMGWIEFQRNIDTWRWQLLIPQMCDPIWAWFVEAAGSGRPSNPVADVAVTWTPPRREMIDPTKETAAARDAIRAGLKSWSEVVREQGEDPEAVAAELAEDMRRFDSLGLVLDTDPRKDPRRQQGSQSQSQLE